MIAKKEPTKVKAPMATVGEVMAAADPLGMGAIPGLILWSWPSWPATETAARMTAQPKYAMNPRKAIILILLYYYSLSNALTDCIVNMYL